MTEPKTITDIKASFLRSQIRLLSAPLQVSSNWQSRLHLLPEDVSGLSSATTEDIVSKVNKKVQSHNRLVFSAQSQRHVAEQVDALYWRDVLASHEAGFEVDPEATIVERDADLCDKNAVKRLPEEYDELYISNTYARDEEESRRYSELRTQLSELGQRRDELQRKVESYAKLQRLIRPLDDAQVNIQSNLVTRDGELSKELDRMRILLARVTGRIGELEHLSQEDGATQDVMMTENQKLANILQLG